METTLLKKLANPSFLFVAYLFFSPNILASLELLAGVEAGIETATSMTTTDLEQTQQALSKQQVGKAYAWQNEDTGTYYKIIIDQQYSFGQYPCLAYNLIIKHKVDESVETKSLDACKNKSGQWISITPSATTL